MSLKNIDIGEAIRRLADRKIEEAMREGKFDNLPGAGKPLNLEPIPAHEEARLTWWALKIMRQNDFTPDEVRWRKQVETLKEELSGAVSVWRVKSLVRQINGAIEQINTLGTNAIRSDALGFAPLSLDARRAPVSAGAAASLSRVSRPDVQRGRGADQPLDPGASQRRDGPAGPASG